MNTPNSTITIKTAVPGGGIKKSLLTPCRRIGLSKKWKLGSFKSPLSQESPVLIYDSPISSGTKQSPLPSGHSTPVTVETKRKNEVEHESKSKRIKRDVEPQKNVKKKLIDDGSDNEADSVNILNISGCNLLGLDEKTENVDEVVKDNKSLNLNLSESPKTRELRVNLERLPSDKKSITTIEINKTITNNGNSEEADNRTLKEKGVKTNEATKNENSKDMSKRMLKEGKSEKRNEEPKRGKENDSKRIKAEKNKDDIFYEKEIKQSNCEQNKSSLKNINQEKFEDKKRREEKNQKLDKDRDVKKLAYDKKSFKTNEATKSNGNSKEGDNRILKEREEKAQEWKEENFNKGAMKQTNDEEDRKIRQNKIIPSLTNPVNISPKTIIAQLKTKPIIDYLDESSTIFKEKSVSKQKSKSKSSFDEYIKRKEKEKTSSSSSFRKLSMKKSTTKSDSFESDDEFLEKPSSQKVIDKSEIVDKILQLQKVITEKETKLEQYKQADVYHKLHDVKQLETLTKTWKNGCENALQDLLLKLNEHVNIDMQGLLKKLGAPIDLLKYDTENGIFV